jgi:hypothetical protein
MLDSLLTQSASRDYGLSQELPKAAAKSFEEGADSEFQRILEKAEVSRQELRRSAARDDYDKAVERRRDEDREALKRKERAEGEKAAGDEADSEEAAAAAEEAKDSKDASSFQNRKPRGRTLAYATLKAEMTLPNGMKRSIGHAMLLSGDSETGLNGMRLESGESPVSVLKGTLEELGASPGLSSLTGTTLEGIQAVLLESGVSQEETLNLLGNLVGEDGTIKMLDLLKALSQAEDWLKVNGPANGLSNGLTATGEGLNSLGQFLMGLGLSAETVKQLTSQLEVGSIIQTSTLIEIVSGGGAANLQASVGEGDLNFLALALQSMGASFDSLNNLSMLLQENQGQVSLGSLLEFLKTLEKPATQTNVAQIAQDIQDIALKVESQSEVVKAPVFNEILLKLSLLGDRELDKNFFELSPALQALRGGVSGIRDDAAAGGDFNQSGRGNNGEDRKEREERRMMGATAVQAGGSGAVAGAFSGSLYDEVASYSSQDGLARQLGQKMLYSARRGVRRLKMSLAPESLGQLSIELKVSGNKLTANIQAESLEAYRALEKEAMALKDSLGAEGIELKLTLGYSGEDGSNADGYFKGPGNESHMGLTISEDDLAAEEESSGQDGITYANGNYGPLLDTVV